MKNRECKQTHLDGCRHALAHYQAISNMAGRWMPLVEKAIEFYAHYGESPCCGEILYQPFSNHWTAEAFQLPWRCPKCHKGYILKKKEVKMKDFPELVQEILKSY